MKVFFLVALLLVGAVSAAVKKRGILDVTHRQPASRGSSPQFRSSSRFKNSQTSQQSRVRQRSSVRLKDTRVSFKTQGGFAVPLKMTKTDADRHAHIKNLNEHHDDILAKTQSQHRFHNHVVHQGTPGVPIALNSINSKSEFVGEVSVGTPPQGFDVIFDTGSVNLFIPGSPCVPDEVCKQHRQFRPEDSSSFRGKNLELTVVFGTGGLTGVVGQDTFRLGSTNGPNLPVTNQSFAIINAFEGDVFADKAFDGILGLSFPGLSGPGDTTTPVFDNVIQQQILQHNQFSFFFSRSSQASSLLQLGEPNQEYYHAPLIYIEVAEQAYWEVAMKEIYVGGHALGVCKGSDGCRAVFDTGTSLITGPTKTVSTLINAIPDIPCVNYTQLPPVTFELGDSSGYHKFDLPPEVWVMRSPGNGQDCAAGFMALDLPKGPKWILGNLFMQQYFTLFSRGNPPKIGVALGRN